MHHFETVLDKSLRAAILLAGLVGLYGIFRYVVAKPVNGSFYTAILMLFAPGNLAASDSLNFGKDRVESLLDVLRQVVYLPGFSGQQSWLVLVARLPG